MIAYYVERAKFRNQKRVDAFRVRERVNKRKYGSKIEIPFVHVRQEKRHDKRKKIAKIDKRFRFPFRLPRAKVNTRERDCERQHDEHSRHSGAVIIVDFPKKRDEGSSEQREFGIRPCLLKIHR